MNYQEFQRAYTEVEKDLTFVGVFRAYGRDYCAGRVETSDWYFFNAETGEEIKDSASIQRWRAKHALYYDISSLCLRHTGDIKKAMIMAGQLYQKLSWVFE